MLLSHPVLRIKCRTFLHVVAPTTSVRQRPLQLDQALTRVLSRPPEVVILVSTDRIGQPIARSEKVDCTCLPIVASENTCCSPLLGRHLLVHARYGPHQLLPSELIAEMLR